METKFTYMKTIITRYLAGLKTVWNSLNKYSVLINLVYNENVSTFCIFNEFMKLGFTNWTTSTTKSLKSPFILQKFVIKLNILNNFYNKSKHSEQLA